MPKDKTSYKREVIKALQILAQKCQVDKYKIVEII